MLNANKNISKRGKRYITVITNSHRIDVNPSTLSPPVLYIIPKPLLIFLAYLKKIFASSVPIKGI
jgi:hypothetical protein